MRDLRSLTKDQTHVPCIEGEFFNSLLDYQGSPQVNSKDLIGFTEQFLDQGASHLASTKEFQTAKWLSDKESAYQAQDTGLIQGSRRSPREGNSNPLQYSFLGNPMDQRAWWAIVHGL